MKANHTEFLQLLNGEVQYVVPRWQRRYCWDESDIGRLVDDLLALGTSPLPKWKNRLGRPAVRTATVRYSCCLAR